MERCEPCQKSFATRESLLKHLEMSSWHKPACSRCNHSFKSREALEQHVRDSPRHHLCFQCVSKPDFKTKQRLIRHARKLHSQQQMPGSKTPLDEFFESFMQAEHEDDKGGDGGSTSDGFRYDPSLSPATSWDQLCRQRKWRRGRKECDAAWVRYQHALKSEIQIWYGDENDLAAWQTICRAVGIKSPPEAILDAKKLLKKTHVNIVDLVESGRSGHTKEIKVFDSLSNLKDYTFKERKFFPLQEAKNTGEESNIVLKYLLRDFSGRPHGPQSLL